MEKSMDRWYAIHGFSICEHIDRMDLYGIDLNLLVAFDALMAERSVTKAGKRIGRTQSAMSAALARLRALLKDELFVRGKGPLQPTPRAMELAEPIARALREIGDTLGVAQAFDPAASGLTLNVAMQEHATFKLMPSLFQCLSRQAPRSKLNIVTYRARDDAVDLLDKGECDVAVGVPPGGAPGRIFTLPLFEEPFVCVVRKGHPAAVQGRIDLEAFLELEHLLVSPEGDRFGHTDAELAKARLTRSLRVTASQMYPVPALVAQSDLIATLMLGVVEMSGWADRLEIFPPPVPLAPCPFVMCWHRRNDTLPVQQWLRDCIQKISADAPVETTGRKDTFR
jgi:DNA-binding transcriptional LysR family regulator